LTATFKKSFKFFLFLPNGRALRRYYLGYWTEGMHP